MTDLYVVHVSEPRRSQNADTHYYTVELIDQKLNVFHSFVCDKYRNYKHWREIITRSLMNGDVIHVQGDWFFKDRKTIDADSKPIVKHYFDRDSAMSVFYDWMRAQEVH